MGTVTYYGWTKLCADVDVVNLNVERSAGGKGFQHRYLASMHGNFSLVPRLSLLRRRESLVHLSHAGRTSRVDMP